MLNARTFREIVSGRKRGVVASAWRVVLAFFELPYFAVVRWRNLFYDWQIFKTHRVGVPVICVGNITMGGTGKTPMVRWIAEWLEREQIQVALVSRGYGTATGEKNDEALELETALPNVPHLQNPDRVAAARQAIKEFQSECILLDDGFQHRRLHRDLDIVLLDALEPFGFDHVFPRGTLREPLAGLQRAKIICLSRADAISTDERKAIRSRVETISNAAWCEVAHMPSELVSLSGEKLPLDNLQGKRVAAFCGIGNPAGFRHTLNSLGYEVVAWKEFADHHHYTTENMASLQQWATESNANAMVCTQKDLVKLHAEQVGSMPIHAVVVELQVLSGKEELVQVLQQTITK